MTTRIRVIFMSCVTILVCLAVMAVGTFALFAETFKVTNHLTAGTLDVTLYRTYLVSGNTNSTVTVDNSQRINFSNTNSSNANIFDLESDGKICPGAYFEATMCLTNSADSDVDVNYTIEILLSANTSATADAKLLEQLEMKVYKADANNVKGEEYVLTAGKTQAAELEIGKSAYFIVRVEFKSSNANDLAQNGTVIFDMTVNAVQVG